jgi:2-iminobutanoate/2-iminopropanoate deaminase
MSELLQISAPDAPPAVGPYSHGIRFGDLLFCSGQLPLDPKTGEVVEGTAADQITRCLENLEAVCRAAQTSLKRAVRVTIYTTALARFAELNAAYASFFGDSAPARVTVGVAALPLGAAVEVEATVAC